MSRPTPERIADIIAAVQRAQQYQVYLVGDNPLKSMAYDAVLRNLAVIGEAVRSLPAECRQTESVPWSSIIGLRNIVVHEYFRVDETVIIDILENHLQTLLNALTSEMTVIEEPPLADD
jgi:uncharacterized protein with HEPN domain